MFTADDACGLGRRDRRSQHRLDRRSQHGVLGPAAPDDLRRVGALLPDRGQKRAQGGQLGDRARHSLDPVDHRRQLHERVVGGAGRGRVPALPADGDREGGRALLTHAERVGDPAAVLDPLPAALVHDVVGPDQVGMLHNQPGETPIVSDLLVRDGAEDQIARPPPSLAGEDRDRRPLRRPPGPSCRGRRAPTRTRRARSPRTAAPTTRRRRRRRRRCGPGASATAHRRCRAGGRRATPGPARARPARPRRRRRPGTPRGARPRRSRSRAGSRCRCG